MVVSGGPIPSMITNMAFSWIQTWPWCDYTWSVATSPVECGLIMTPSLTLDFKCGARGLDMTTNLAKIERMLRNCRLWRSTSGYMVLGIFGKMCKLLFGVPKRAFESIVEPNWSPGHEDWYCGIKNITKTSKTAVKTKNIFQKIKQQLANYIKSM